MSGGNEGSPGKNVGDVVWSDLYGSLMTCTLCGTAVFDQVNESV